MCKLVLLQCFFSLTCIKNVLGSSFHCNAEQIVRGAGNHSHDSIVQALTASPRAYVCEFVELVLPVIVKDGLWLGERKGVHVDEGDGVKMTSKRSKELPVSV